ncbi:MAG TPA: ABC transporter permease [Dehalococcoidales bacterium]|nr:ABC transporter permease [Dehalococcoidales bacterium]
MKARRIWILVKNELLHGPKDVILIMAVLLPVLMALFTNLAFGNIFTEKPAIGIFDEGNSGLTGLLKADESLQVRTYTSAGSLKEAAGRGAVDIGVILSPQFAEQVQAGTVYLQAYVWGESQAKNRALIPMALSGAIRELRGDDLPVTLEIVSLGGGETQPWSSRLLPITILIAVFFGGMMLPAASLIHEKNRRTLEALNVTPVTIGEIFGAKGIIGIILASIMGMITLVISGGLSNLQAALLLFLILGAVMASLIGLIVGAMIKDLNTLYAFWKFGGILLFGPALVYIFPQIPQWIGYFFPTYYVIKPIIELSSGGQSLGEVLGYLLVLLGLITLLFLLVRQVIRRLSSRALRING